MTGPDSTLRYSASLVWPGEDKPFAVVDTSAGTVVHMAFGVSTPGYYADPIEALVWAQRFNVAHRQDDGEDYSAAALPDAVVDAGRVAGGPFAARRLDGASWGVVGPDGANLAGVADPYALGGLTADSYATEAEAQRCADWMNGALALLTAEQPGGAA